MDNLVNIFTISYASSNEADPTLYVDLEYEDNKGFKRVPYAYRADSIQGNLPAQITQWIADNNPEILPYIPPPLLTPEELRVQMPRKSMVEFRAALRKVKTSVFPNGIYAADINTMIDQIADLDLQEEARDYFNLGQYAERINSWVDIFGLMAGLTSEQIDVFWVA